jgi:hypothetical protein
MRSSTLQFLGSLILAIVLAGCGGTTTAAGIAPARVSWCGKPVIAFEDDGVAPPATITSWPAAQKLLGFAPLLPTQLPRNACLSSGGGVVRNPLFGSRFTVIYALPDDGALSIAEVPTQHPMPQPQCSAAQPSSTVAIATCQQTQGGINVTIASSLSADRIRALLASLRPNVAWVPGS